MSVTGAAWAVPGGEPVSLAAAALDVGAQVTLGVLAHATRLIGGLGADRGEDLFGRCARRGELALGRVSRRGADARGFGLRRGARSMGVLVGCRADAVRMLVGLRP